MNSVLALILLIILFFSNMSLKPTIYFSTPFSQSFCETISNSHSSGYHRSETKLQLRITIYCIDSTVKLGVFSMVAAALSLFTLKQET